MKRVFFFTLVLCLVLASFPATATEDGSADAPPPDTSDTAPSPPPSVPDSIPDSVPPVPETVTPAPEPTPSPDAPTDTPSTDTPSTDTPSTDTPTTDTPSTDTPADGAEPVAPVLPDVIDGGSFLPDGLPSGIPTPPTVTYFNTYSVNGSTPSTGLSGVIADLFGTYTPKTQTVTVVASDGSTASYTEYVPGIAGMDMEWLAAVVLFALILYCIFRLAGGVFR